MSDISGLQNAPHLAKVPGYTWVGYTLMTDAEIRAEGWFLRGTEWVPGPLSRLREAGRETARIRNERIAKALSKRQDIDAEQAEFRRMYPGVAAIEAGL